MALPPFETVGLAPPRVGLSTPDSPRPRLARLDRRARASTTRTRTSKGGTVMASHRARPRPPRWRAGAPRIPGARSSIWLLFVAAAVGAGSAVTRAGDDRRRLPRRASRATPTRGSRTPGSEARQRERPHHVAGSGQLDRAAAEQAAARSRAPDADLDRRGEVGQTPRLVARQARRCWCRSRSSSRQPTRRRRRPLLAVTDAVQRAHPSLSVAEVGDASINDAINDTRRRRPGHGRDAQPAGHAAHHAGRLRRSDRCRNPCPARDLGRGRDDLPATRRSRT